MMWYMHRGGGGGQFGDLNLFQIIIPGNSSADMTMQRIHKSQIPEKPRLILINLFASALHHQELTNNALWMLC